MTNGELLKKHYPDQVALIRERVREGFMDDEAETSAPNVLASAFNWFASPEGWEFWNALYENGHD